jgi:glycosyltransferase involved in cell wall biosynthesis
MNETVPGLHGERLCVVVPAFNEEKSIASVVRSVRQAVPEASVVVVDDGSTDATRDEAVRSGATVLSLPVNLGIGGAVQCGYMYALRRGFTVVVQLDGDGQHDATELRRLIAPVVEGHADMTIGSRWLGRGDYTAPSSRRSGMLILARLVRCRTGQRFTDTTSGFRSVGSEALRLFAESYPTDFPEVETLVMARRRGLQIQEVPVQMLPRLHGRSSIAGLRSAYYMARVILLLIMGQPSRGSRS